MAASNIEQFLIEFVFKDKDALKSIKEFVGQYDKLTKQVRQNQKVSEQASRKKVQGIKAEGRALDEQARKQSKLNQLERKRQSFGKTIDKAKGLGIDTGFYERSRASAKKFTTLDKRELELKDQIYQKEKQITAENKRQAAVQKKAILESKQALQMERFKGSRPFTTMQQADPTKARAFIGRMQSAIRSGDILAVQRINNEMRQYASTLRRTKREVLGLHTAQKGLTDSTRNMIRSYVSLFAVFAGVTSINRVGQGFEAMNSAMLSAMGGKQEAAKQIQFLDELTSRLGMSLLGTADQYTKFVFASKGKLPTEEVNFLFQSMAEMGTVLGISKERMKLSMVAIQQMMNKGVVQSEELKRQFAESMPGGIQLFARALKVSEAELFKMMEQGRVISAEVLPAVAKEMSKVANSAGALEEKYKTTRVAQGRFFKQLETAQNTIFTEGFDEGAAEFFNNLAIALQDNQAALSSLGKTFGVLFKAISAGITLVTPPVMALINVVGGLASALDSIFGSGSGVITAGIGAITAAVIMLGRVITTRLAAVTALIFALEELVALATPGMVGITERNLGKDLSIPMLGKDGKENDKPWWMQSTAGMLVDKAKNTITQFISVEVPAGANEEYFKNITKGVIDDSNRRLMNQTWSGGD